MRDQLMQISVLRQGWLFRNTDAEEEWLPVRTVPTNIHLDLLDNGKIEDPFLNFNELKCQWVAEKTWIYRRTLPSTSSMYAVPDAKHVLAFDGLDTYATVRLDGKLVLTSDNMWHMHRVDVTRLLQSRRESVLEIEFKPALIEARRIKDAHPEHKWVGFNADMARLAVRKAQYHFGWDWGPILEPCGPWREVRLETYVARLDDLRVTYDLDESLRNVSGVVDVTLEGSIAGDVVRFKIAHDGNDIVERSTSISTGSTVRVEFAVKDVQLWYPHGYGKQPLYTVTAALIRNGKSELHSVSKRIGFRKGELMQIPDSVGKSFYFRFNNVDIFCGGSDWIPADSFTPRISTARYRSWLQTMVDGHQVMIRVWGGGIWEEDAFYDICDELGILVWQDFMFGCGNYPATPEILKSIGTECIQQTKRLRHHPSLAIYAGNNEDYQVQESFGLTYNYEDKDPESWLKTDFPARYIYEKLLPDIVAKYTPHIPYHPGSPWGDGKITSDPTVGDMHQWNVWHGTQEKYQIYDTLGGRFNSEFGMEGFPHLETIQHFVSDPRQLFPQSHVIDFHNKADGHERRIATYLVENFRVESYDLEKYIYLTQMSQADALMFGYRGWRRQWDKGGRRHCGGALVWQLNDCWPTISWAIIDYYQRKKPAYYAMCRVLAPVAVAVKREHWDWSVVHARPAKTLSWECWISSFRTESISAKVEIRFISIATGEEIKDKQVFEDIAVKANGTTTISSGCIDNEKEEPHVLAARLWIDGQVVSRDVDWPQPFKYLDFSDRGVQVTQSNSKISVKASKPVKGLTFEEREGVLINDSGFDVMPGDEQEIVVTGMIQDAKPLRWRYLGAP